MTKPEWLASASTLCKNLQEDPGLPNASNLKLYQAIRSQLFPKDNHHAPSTTRGSVLLPQVRDWMTQVKASQFDNRF